ncbi:MAG: Eco57I restriction-modification methylase domain-containing protein [Bacteroidaceae bacterium]|nr:Eco57I restriction-modification methylase domain-containing protein [Bacteroidaceae bacterium]
MTYTRDNLRQIFQQPFNEEGWQNMLRQYFHATELKAERERIDDTPDDEKGYYLGAIDTTDNYRIGLFYYQIQHGNVARKRVGLRNLVKSFVNPNWGEFDAALVVFDNSSVWRLSFVCDIKGENTAAKRFTYVFGESDNYYNTPVGRFDALQRNGISFENIKDAFSVERLNKDFFNGYKERYVKFLKHINDDTKENRDYVKKLLGRLVFLQFLQKKGWMGVPAIQQGWNGGDKFYLNHLIDSYEGNDRLLSDVLEPLFFNTLNERRGNDLADSRLGKNIKIPYLNGGLFDKDELDKKDIDFPYDYFKELMDFFAMYNFTIDENDPEDSEIGIDPEMLGHIFENLLEDNKDKGAFYTPKEIVQYMSQESVGQYLKSHTPEDLHASIDTLIKQKDVDALLKNKAQARLVNKLLADVKVCDPAIGSGAFPMGVLNVLFDCRHLLYPFTGSKEDFSWAKVKREIIQNNIYGVDIEKGAVDIARLRFWLALVVDENEPQPLPNLDYKIMCGDSLLHRFALDAPFQNVLKDYNQKSNTHYTLDDYRQWVYDYTNISDHTQKDNFRQKIEDIKRAVKTELSDKEKGKIAKVRGAIDNLQMGDFFGDKKKENEKKIKALQKELKALEQQRAEIESNKIYDQAFEWRFEFPALLDEKGDFMGFDIVIGNPPYIQLQANKGVLADLYSKQNYKTFVRTGDIYSLFYEQGWEMLDNNGCLCFITSNKWMRAGYGESTRDFFAKYTDPKILIDFSGVDIFDSATVVTNILLFTRSANKGQTLCVATSNQHKECVNNLYEFVDANNYIQNLSTSDGWIILTPIENTIKQKITNAGIPLKDWDVDIYRGILTGFNDAFIITTETRQEILNNCVTDDERIRTDKLIKPILRGRDIVRNGYDWANLWLINTHNGYNDVPRIDINKYPSVKKHLDNYWNKISTRSDKGDTPYNLRNCAYINEFEKPKVIYPETTKGARFVFDESGIFIDKTCFMLISDAALYLQKTLSSKLFEVAYNKMFSSVELVNHTYQYNKHALLKLPVIYDADAIRQLTSIDDEQQIDLLVYQLYGLTYDEVLIVDPETPITREEYKKVLND